jgi:hypothetical protein
MRHKGLQISVSEGMASQLQEHDRLTGATPAESLLSAVAVLNFLEHQERGGRDVLIVDPQTGTKQPLDLGNNDIAAWERELG